MPGGPKNLSASVHARLMNLARAGGRSFNDLLQLYAMERFLFRLSVSKDAAGFVLKGALLMRVWDPASYRATRDIDLLGRMHNDARGIAAIMASACSSNPEPDSLRFDAASVRVEPIAVQNEYEGIRVAFLAYLGNARIPMRIDVGFGDVVTPAPRMIDFPVLLGMSAPRLAAYPAESVIAEKFQIMLMRGDANTRMKDFHDIWWLANNRGFDGAVLASAIRATCDRRGTPVQAQPRSLSAEFPLDAPRRAQWLAFRERVMPTDAPQEFSHILATISEFLGPIAESIAARQHFSGSWPPAGPWT
jgi:hypothetical protein